MDQQEHPEAEPKPTRPTLPKEYGMPTDNKGLLEWEWVVERLGKARNYWVSTTRPDGRPHAVPVWAAWVGDTLYFDGHPHTRWGRNLAHNPAISVHLESGDEVVILEGTVEDIASMDHPFAEKVVAAFDAKYGANSSAGIDELVEHGLYALRPQVVLAWSEFPRTMTRWQFS